MPLSPSPSSESNPYADSHPPASVSESPSHVPAPRVTLAAIRGTRLWMYGVSAIGLLLAALMLLSLLGNLTILAQISGRSGFRGNITPLLATTLSFGTFIAGVTTPSILLWRYANSIGRFQRHPDKAQLEKMLVLQRNFWRYSGVVLLGAAGVYVLMAVFTWAIV